MKEISFRCSLYIKLTWLIALPCFVVFLTLSSDVISLLYRKGLSDLVINEFDYSYKLLMISSVSIIYYAFVQTFTSVLQSINKPMLPVVSLSAAMVVRIILLIILVSRPEINIFGQVLANMIFLLVATTLNLVFVRRYIPLQFSVQRMLVTPIFCSIAMGGSMYVVRLGLSFLPVWASLSITALVGGTVYLGLIIVLQCFSPAEAECFPLVGKLLKRREKQG